MLCMTIVYIWPVVNGATLGSGPPLELRPPILHSCCLDLNLGLGEQALCKAGIGIGVGVEPEELATGRGRRACLWARATGRRELWVRSTAWAWAFGRTWAESDLLDVTVSKHLSDALDYSLDGAKTSTGNSIKEGGTS